MTQGITLRDAMQFQCAEVPRHRALDFKVQPVLAAEMCQLRSMHI